MQLEIRADVRAPLDRVRYALETVDEYPAWNPAASLDDGRLQWRLPTAHFAHRTVAASVKPALDATTLHIGDGTLLRVHLRVSATSAGRGRTALHVRCHVAGVASRRTRPALHALAHGFCSDLATRAEWLCHAPDTNYPPLTLGSPGPTDRAAPLEQLRAVTRELEGGILAIDAGSSRCLVDPVRRRFLRAEPGDDPGRLLAFARWQPYDDIWVDGGDVVILPVAGAAAVRIRPHTPAVA